jgi:hypothetical protein
MKADYTGTQSDAFDEDTGFRTGSHPHTALRLLAREKSTPVPLSPAK